MKFEDYELEYFLKDLCRKARGYRDKLIIKAIYRLFKMLKHQYTLQVNKNGEISKE